MVTGQRSGFKLRTYKNSFVLKQRNGKRTFFHNRGANALLDYEDFADIDIDAKIFYLGYLLLLDKLDNDDEEFGTIGAKVLSTMQKKGLITVVDFVSEAPEKFKKVVLSALPYIDVLVINEIEAGNSFDISVRDCDDVLDCGKLEDVARKFLDAGVSEMVIFHYAEGAFLMEKNGIITKVKSIDIERKNIIGTNGAGDAFCAGILYGLHEGLPINEMLDIANVSAIFNLSSPTASGGAKTLQEMKRFLRN